MTTEHGLWYINFGVKVPTPEKESKAFYESGPTGDGEIYTICEYSDKNFQRLINMSIWKEINSQTDIDLISDRINTIKNWITNNGTKNNDLFLKYPVPINKSNLYYLKSKDSDGFFLLICNKQSNKLYGLELTN
ncbi:hypothetical protein [Clostridium folliculivorans]|uniref:Uncharacterized protein n=1 Tax=Clostridium folliculivorans TaxID=2886038 RepID=A0A9W6DAQ5_9CLOT|nr:hypothetical protein [Clostridium folliculivorans]GKU25469.1 hypothetical protein CFOLD11_22950 [Clostridium folliculivorans]GKU28491.1 hypothetical protein CFB3_05970 [Clostridium folliculivorans]